MNLFHEFFQRAMGGEQTVAPYPYQSKFATEATLPHLLRVPTSAGKTATAILGWLYRWQTQPKVTPRRLVYCLPMRVLAEQSERVARRWIDNLGLDIPVYVLMGGVETDEWFLHPEQPAVLIGTQDMLLSRALNRGYAASRFHWPIDFGLLNNDCLWVFDEPQLMASGVSTSAQLAGLRRSFETFGDCPSVWMSATLEPGWLDTVDFRGKFSAEPLELSDDDYDPSRPLFQRMTAAKSLAPLDVKSSKDMKDVAKAILGSGERTGLHQPNTQTMVVVNTVERAKAVYDELLKLRKKSLTPNLLLVYSRFRPAERRQLNERLQQPGGDRILVATQVVEAGVDISARTLVTELAPWSSLVQRMGRCNRTGHDGPGQVFWIDLDEKLSPPYSSADLAFARKKLEKLEDQSVSPRDLDHFKARENITLPFEHKHVFRRRDLLDLFDTAPDLSGNDIDIQRFVRGDDPEIDVQVFWRDVGDSPQVGTSPHRNATSCATCPWAGSRLPRIAGREKTRSWLRLGPSR
jgi:CRISPR-associated endonuclease/helicase Cas3